MNSESDFSSDIFSFYGDKEKLDRILSSLNSGLVLLRPDMTVEWANKLIWQMFPGEDLYGKKCYAIAEKRDSPCENCQTIFAFKDGKIHEREFQNQHNNRWYSVIAFPIKNQQGDVTHVLESTTDIDDRRQAEIIKDSALNELKILKEKLEEENIFLKSEVREAGIFLEIIGSSNVLCYILDRINQVAETKASVLINGETGVGKELVARAIHKSSARSDKPFVSINCAALQPTLIESELFGHERGSFTDASQQRKGRFELANTGTLFLDEIGELPRATQAKLLRVLEDGKYERVGGSTTMYSDARIIVATNMDLDGEVRSGRFRADLLFRLKVFPISVPPLRKRIEDIPQLVDYFVEYYNRQLGRCVERISRSDMELLQNYSWPGNVRELRNVIERAMITNSTSKLVLQDFQDTTLLEKQPEKNSPQDIVSILPMEDVERNHILRALEVCSWQVGGTGGAAEKLKINPSTLRSRMKKLGICKPEN